MTWTDEEIAKLKRRVDVLQKFALNEDEASDLASRLLQRDRDKSDDRRICLECKWLKVSYCNSPKKVSPCKSFEPCKTVLWRCDQFKLKGS